MYSGNVAAAGVATYNPAADGSAAQMQSMPPASQPTQYYGLPGPGPQQMAGAAPPGAPVTTQMPAAGYSTGPVYFSTDTLSMVLGAHSFACTTKF